MTGPSLSWHHHQGADLLSRASFESLGADHITSAMPRAAPLEYRLDKATLEKLYNEQGLSTIQIAERYGSYSSNVIVLMEKYGISRRPRGRKKMARPGAT